MAYFTDLDRSFSLDFNLPQCRSPYWRIYASSEDDDQQPQSEQQTPEEANASNFMNPGNLKSMQKQEAEIFLDAEKVPSQMEVMESTLSRLEQRVSELCGELSQMKDILSNYFKGKIHGFELITFEDAEDIVNDEVNKEREQNDFPSGETILESDSDNVTKKATTKRNVKALLTDFDDMLHHFSDIGSVDNVAINEGDMILFMDERYPFWKGVGVVTSKGGVERSHDFAIGDHVSGTCVYVERGKKYGGTSWVVTNKEGEDVVGRDKITFARFDEKSTQFGEPSESSESSGPSVSSGSSSSGTDFTGRIQLTSIYENNVCHLENGKYVVTITRNDGVSSGAFVVHKSDQSCWGTITQLTKDRNEDSAILYWPPNCPLQISNIPIYNNGGYIVDISPDTTGTRTTA